ncbi:MAG TPA: aldehyde dehydrogenase family protein [Candidatus Limnocylindrales bacterium]|jgi:acyl-CoA reductase-like NAD-dependent aldehyde dehydrogenase|nr:aldehyde dehydrogenase family protein [Candidatus Limnocylindrales bacterium]
MLPHLPALRLGRAYSSLDQVDVKDCRTGETLARISQVNAGIIRKDLTRITEARHALKQLSCEKLIQICEKAAELFLNETLPLADHGHAQSPEQYAETLSSTSGLPFVMVKRNSQKIASALSNMRVVLNGLTRGLDLSIIDRGFGEQFGARISFFPAADCLGLVMPSNSPGVNSLWLPAIPLKVPIIVKPGREEPWTAYRIIQAFIAAGCPAEAFGFYPTDHDGAAEILRSCKRAQLFGDKSTTAQYANNPGIQIHGPGYSKILIGEDEVERWRDFIDVIVASISENGGRSCVNASTIVVPKYAAEIAEALAQRLGPIAPVSAADPAAKLSAFANPRMAESIDAAIEEGLRFPGASETTAKYRQGPRKVTFEGATYLRPTVVLCDSFGHPLANREFLFPYASVVQVPQAEMLAQIGPSLVVTAITKDLAFRDALIESPLIDRLNLGPISTMRVSWDQPHEGNLFEFLYRRRAIDLQ